MAHHGRPEEIDGVQCQACRLIRVCCCCGREGDTQPHHEPNVSLGGVDGDAVPLLFECHRRRHDIGANRFWNESRMSPEFAKAAMRDWMAAGCPAGALTWGKR